MKNIYEVMKNMIYNEIDNLSMQEVSNTIGADINEIMMGFFLAGSSWSKFGNGADAKKAVEERKKMVKPEIFDDQVGRAKAMASAVLSWGKQNGYKEGIKKVWWTARPGILSQAVGRPIDSRTNPTDILLDFGGGKFLGVSAKSTKGSGDIGFKNPGLGTMSKNLGVDFASIIQDIDAKIIKKFKLPAGIKARKAFIRSDAAIQQKTIEGGTKVLNILRDALLSHFKTMDQKSLRKHIITNWLDAEGTDPYYIKVTGHGSGGNFTADVNDPINNDKFKLLSNGKIDVMAVGNDSVGITADGKKMLKMRFKYESEKMASSIKLSGDPWSDKK